ncbi:interferon regulatory factor 4-like isoform X2 [Eubalaena glacialis]|uniref:interferon regulatory factor 4-like isoform X2 n=1 Tax=Eubalaena glacialis TaxID=27606 RepID=UPI002A59FDE0|nr:interferon regulatory factor 4-like isoform X2 [Eubalaena glacialis]
MAGDQWRRDEGRVPDSRRLMAGAGGPLRLREWLVAQIESGRYAGLRWEDAGKTLFRIPWKHAAKQGYQAQQDAALFRAWAIYKGKHLEGVDKEDPSTWKTRLRCALNKSADFCEVRSRSQLDISNPYKVYRLLSDGAHSPVTRGCAPCKEEGILHSQQVPPGEVTEPACKTEEQVGSRLVIEDKDKEQPPRLAQQDSLPPAALPPGPLADHRYQAQDPAHPWGPSPSEDFSNPDFWLHVRLFYGAELVREATARAADGCSLSPRAAAAAAELLLGPPPRVAQVRFPEPPPGARVLRRLLPHLERGVLLWVAPEGVFAKRLCQGRVYWRGPLAPHRARPNKLERERTCQLLDTRRFLAELRAHLQDGRQEPEYQIRLCFGEEYPGPPDQPEERLIMAHVSHLPLQRRTTPSSLPERPLTAPSSPSSAPDLPYDPLIWKTLRVKCMWRGAVTPAHPPTKGVGKGEGWLIAPPPPRRWSQSSRGSSSYTRSSTARCLDGAFPAPHPRQRHSPADAAESALSGCFPLPYPLKQSPQGADPTPALPQLSQGSLGLASLIAQVG